MTTKWIKPAGIRCRTTPSSLSPQAGEGVSACDCATMLRRFYTIGTHVGFERMNRTGARGLIAVDKMGGKVLFLDPASYATTQALDDFERLPHELLVRPQSLTAYVPIYGDGIHGRNPNPGHLLSVVDLATRSHVTDIDLSPYVAPHGLQVGPDGLLYITCENSGVVALIDPARNEVVGAIETGSVNSHRLAIAPDGRWLYTENEEDASIS